MRKTHDHYITKAITLVAAFLAAVIMTGTASPAFALPDTGAQTAKEPIMVSLGDSYSSGEGVTPFYYEGWSDKYTQPDWLAHRSKLSWPGKLKLTDSEGNRLTMSKNKAYYDSKTKSYDSYSKDNWYFVASSGAVTGSLKGTQTKYYEPDADYESPLGKNYMVLDSQLKVFESIEPGTTDYVTMTMGGNDAHFADVFIYAALNCSFINVNGMNDYLGKIWDEFYNGANSIQNRLRRAYTDIHNAAGNQADIIIVGYPKILPKKGALIFSKEEAADINSSITKLNGEIQNIVDSFRSEDFKIHFVSVEEAFEGHEIYTGIFKEYINGIQFVRREDLSKTQVISSYSLHPNKKGVAAYAACVQSCIDSIEREKGQNAPVENSQPDDARQDGADLSLQALPPAPLSGESTGISAPAGESTGISAPAGESITIPVTLHSEVPLTSCSLHVAYDSALLQIDAVSGDDSAAVWSDPPGEGNNGLDVHLQSAGEALTADICFDINATVLSEEEAVIHLRVDAVNDTDSEALLQAVHCEDVIINDARSICTLTADLSALGDAEGVQIFATDSSLCALRDSYATAQQQLTLRLIADASSAEICFYKPGCTRLFVVIEDVAGGETRDITAALTEAAAQYRLLSAGDVDGDGCVSELDVTRLTAADNFGTAAEEADAAADVNADGILSLEDIALILLAENYGAADLTITCAPEGAPSTITIHTDKE